MYVGIGSEQSFWRAMSIFFHLFVHDQTHRNLKCRRRIKTLKVKKIWGKTCSQRKSPKICIPKLTLHVHMYCMYHGKLWRENSIDDRKWGCPNVGHFLDFRSLWSDLGPFLPYISMVFTSSPKTWATIIGKCSTCDFT
jgi:hypothetical protein